MIEEANSMFLTYEEYCKTATPPEPLPEFYAGKFGEKEMREFLAERRKCMSYINTLNDYDLRPTVDNALLKGVESGNYIDRDDVNELILALKEWVESAIEI